MLKRFLRPMALLFGLMMSGIAGAQSPSDYGLPANIQDGNILHLFCWSAKQAREMLPEIAEAGFTAIQLSPVQGNASAGAEWYYAYLPYDFAFRSSGTASSKSDLKNLCDEAHKYGIKVIVDVVANHINGKTSNRNSWWNTNDRLRATTAKVNYNNRTSIIQHRLGDYPDVNSESAEVQERAVAFVKDLVAQGIDGIRWDAAKHIGLPSENCGFWSAVIAAAPDIYHYGEILDTPGGSKANALMQEYTTHMSVTDNKYCTTVLNSVKGGSVPSSKAGWATSVIPENKVVYWGESHDTYANEGGATKFVEQAQIDRAWAIVASRAKATSLYLSRPPQTGYSAIKMSTKGSTHFTAPEIAAVNKFRNAMVGKDDYYTGANGVASITRKDGGAVIVVGKGGSQAVSVANGGGYCPAGTYTDLVSGRQFTVTPTTISGTTGTSGIAVIMAGAQNNAPSVLFSPEGGQFRGETLDVEVELINSPKATLKFENKTIDINPGKTTITIGANTPFGQSVDINWTALYDDGKTSKAGYVSFLKLDPAARPSDMPANFYIIGQVNGNSWDPASGVKMNEDGATFTADVTIQGAFSFASALGTAGNWSAFNGAGVRYGASGSDKAITLGGTAPFEKLSDPKAYTLSGGTAGTKYTIVIDWQARTVGVRNVSGIDAVEIEEADGPVEYYNLQGVRVDEPSAPGIYIRRQGATASKIYIR
ncbi:MAG: hypothetical protein K2M06_07990 [Muribaculaceae bacterium]|nr:hypothetical protein [Muribaculaceae bacterium]